MRRKILWIAAGCVLVVVGLRPAFSSGAPPTSTERVIYSFTGGSDGGAPLSNLTFDKAGNLYGTTSAGGTGTACNGGCGTVFELQHTKDGWKEQVLYSFSGGADGRAPAAGVTFDKFGSLYGTTASGGRGAGAVFKLAPNSKGGWTESVIYTFSCGSDGCVPLTDLVFDAHGNLVGTTSAGSTCNNGGCGTVWELIPQSDGSWKEVTIYEFTGAPDGAVPSSPVQLDSLGNTFGLTEFGGTGHCLYLDQYPGCGTVYELTSNSGGKWTESVIYNFARGGGFAVNPSSGLILDGAGHLFGTTLGGGDGLGTIFELRLSQKKIWAQSVPHRFYGNPDGSWPVGRVEMNSDGALFGVASRGGANKDGIVFALRPSRTNGWTERVLHSFAPGGDGLAPRAGVVSDSHGHLYGTTQFGGSGTSCNGGCGAVYEVTP